MKIYRVVPPQSYYSDDRILSPAGLIYMAAKSHRKIVHLLA